MNETEKRLVDLRIEQLELEIARQNAPKKKESLFTSPILLAIAGATATALTGLVTNQLQLNANRQLERDKLEYSLILKAVESEDAHKRVDALKFLVTAGLVTDTNGKIEHLKASEVPQIQSGSSLTSSALLRPTPSEYRQLFETATFTDKRIGIIDDYKLRLEAGRRRYETVSKQTGVPWFVIGILHQVETNGNFDVHFHNGDPLGQRTVSVPAGRPTLGSPPFTWEESALDALQANQMSMVSVWTIEEALYQIERFNGLGYRKRGINSPYLWAGSNHYTSGTYTTDGGFNAKAVSRLVGAAVLLKFAVPPSELKFLLSQSAQPSAQADRP